jgi:hypothetical protein
LRALTAAAALAHELGGEVHEAADAGALPTLGSVLALLAL